MKRSIRNSLLILVSIFVLFGYGIYWLFYDTQRFTGQEEICHSDSPDGKYTVTAYLNNGGATTSFAVLCTVENNTTGREKNIYWNYRCDSAEILWMDTDTVIINGITLDVKTDVYDFRHE